MSGTRPKPEKPATIADVAALAGVAKSSVSNYLNGQVRVADATAARIAMAITRLDYRPATVARSFTSRRSSSFDVTRLPPGLPCLTAVGHAGVDTIAQVPGLPTGGGLMTAPRIHKVLGGPSSNVAVIAAGLGGDLAVAASFLTSLGYDLDSDWIKAELASRHVTVISPTAHQDTVVSQRLTLLEPGGRRTIVTEPVDPGDVGLEAFLARHQKPPDRRWCLHFDGCQVAAQIERIATARQAGFLTSMHSTGLTPEALEELIAPMLDTFSLIVIDPTSVAPGGCDALVERLAGMARQRDSWPEAVIVSQDLDGIAAIDPAGGVIRQRPPKIDPIDETGVVDAITATCVAAWLNDVPQPQALALASAAAAIVARSLGAQERRPLASDLAVAP